MNLEPLSAWLVLGVGHNEHYRTSAHLEKLFEKSTKSQTSAFWRLALFMLERLVKLGAFAQLGQIFSGTVFERGFD